MNSKSLVVLNIGVLPAALENLGPEWRLCSAKPDPESSAWLHFLTRKADYPIGKPVTIHFEDSAHGCYLKDMAPFAAAPVPSRDRPIATPF